MARPSSVALGLLAAGVLAMGASLLEVVLADHVSDSGLQQTQALTRQLGLTDPALMTEARYGRHLSQADRHTPFQDHPLAFDHFPTGSLLPAPRP
ncbi:MAG: hypothetical protein WAS90_06650 [Brachymonas denitrificans]|uniref:hypothetical protein n=1 Tax=Brachymonas denitrificans TaxID=28220 RepID=UPI00321FC3CA